MTRSWKEGKSETETRIVVNSSQTTTVERIADRYMYVAAHLEDEAFRREAPGSGAFFWPTGGL